MTTADLRRVRGQRTRRAIVDAALDLFETVGYEATTVDLIAERAGVAPRTCFHHFPSKELIVFDGYADRLDHATRRLRDQPPRAALARVLDAVADAVVEAIEAQPETFRRRSRLCRSEPSLRATMLALNETWIDEVATEIAVRLRLDPEIDVRPRLAASLLNSANRAAIDLWTASDDLDLRRLSRQSRALIEPALGEIERGLRLEPTEHDAEVRRAR